jgi:predicted Zn-dependent protease
MQEYFYQIADLLAGLLRGEEVYTCSYSGEVSGFVRFNRSRVRQAGQVVEHRLTVDLIEGRRHAAGELTLSGDPGTDEVRLGGLVEELRAIGAHVPEDPYLLYATEVRSSEQVHPDRLPEPGHMVERILAAGQGRDLVGIHASGAMHAGFANSLGQRNWYTRHSFNLDWSFYLHTDKAVKARYAGFEWDDAELARRVAQAAEQLEALARPSRTLRPGRYRVYLTPTALDELVGMLSWGGFGLRAHRTKTTPLLRMVEDDARLHPAVTLAEHTAEGIAPGFQSAGFVRAPRVVLIEHGAYRDCLVSPRSAMEYGAPANGASEGEAPLSIDMAPGNLARDAILRELDTGLYIGNLWYLNYSDRSAGRMTGMTRFATFWVEHGRIVAPVEVMRFDDTIYHLLGDRLAALTAERELLLDPDTYGGRSTRSARLPGALVDGMTFTL